MTSLCWCRLFFVERCKFEKFILFHIFCRKEENLEIRKVKSKCHIFLPRNTNGMFLFPKKKLNRIFKLNINIIIVSPIFLFFNLIKKPWWEHLLREFLRINR